MTITIECEWDEGYLIADEMLADGKKIPHTNLSLYVEADRFLRSIRRWKIEQDKRNVSP